MKQKRRQQKNDVRNALEDESTNALLSTGPPNAAVPLSIDAKGPGVTTEKGAAATKKKKNKALRMIKIVLPHICLTLFILCYIVMGAAIFKRIEYQHDLDVLEKKATQILRLYNNITNKVKSFCEEKNATLTPTWEEDISARLRDLSKEHVRLSEEVTLNATNPKEYFKSRWSYIDGILYAISILTTTGYVNATPITYLGQIVTVIYGLFGIPLMVLTAVDYGRFLSDIVLFLYAKLAQCSNKIFRICGCLADAARRKVSSNVRVETKLLEDGRVEKVDETKRKPKLPLWANFSILLLFNTLGAFVYMLHGQTKPDFLESFFVCFNLVANLTMGEVPVVRDVLMVIYIVFFVTFGLAVLSMCADLAASELKWLFLKIHYFGRKIRQKAKSVDEDLDMSLSSLLNAWYEQSDVPVYVEEVELKELLKIIEEIRNRYPSKHKITRQDILDYIQSQIESPSKEYLWRQRRDTIAFMPATIDVLKFADADDVDEQSVYQRQASAMGSDDSTVYSDKEKEADSDIIMMEF